LDNHHAAELAIDKFVECDYSRVSIITTSVIRNISPRVERIEGYKKALEKHHLPVRQDYIKTADIEHLPDVLHELFQLKSPPEAILAGNDMVLVEVLKYMKEHRLSIPEDAAVIGIDEVPFAGFYSPPISVVAQPKIDMASKAAELLLGKISGENTDTKATVYRMVPRLIDRRSC